MKPLTAKEDMLLRRILPKLDPGEQDALMTFVADRSAPSPRWPTRFDQRDAEIREAYATYYEHLGRMAALKQLEADLNRWAETGWLRHGGDPWPDGISDRERALNRICYWSEGRLVKVSQIRNILAGSRLGF
jgi:hypothetical protein